MTLKDKAVVITGSSKGLGKALAAAFIHEGSRVVISARSISELDNAARETGATPYLADVTKEREVVKLAQFSKRQFGTIDVWINNAGTTISHSSIEEIDDRAAHQVMEVNFFGTFYGSRAAISIMKGQKYGVIVNIVSMSAFVGRPQSLVYSASKWAARGFTKGLRMAQEPNHISVIAVHPGGIKTTMFGDQLPVGYEDWMEPSFVAKSIVRNLRRSSPKEELVVRKK